MKDMSKNARVRELYFLQKFDLLNEEENAELQEFRKKNPDLADMLESESLDSYSSIALSGQSPAPSPNLRKEILKRIAKNRRNIYSRDSGFFTSLMDRLPGSAAPYAITAAAILVAVVFYFQFHLVNEKQNQLDSLMKKTKLYAELAETIYPDKYVIFDLQATYQGIPAKAKVYLTKDHTTGLFQSDTKLPANTKTDYQLWLVKDSQMINGGVIDVSETDSVLYHPLKNLPIADLEQIEGLVITVEPKGGVDAPSGDQIIIGVQAPKEF